MMVYLLRRMRMVRVCKCTVVLTTVAALVFMSNMVMLDSPSFVHTAPPFGEDANGKDGRGLGQQFLKARKLEDYRPNEGSDVAKEDVIHVLPGMPPAEEVKSVVFQENILQSFGHMWTVPTRGVIRRIVDGYIVSNGSIYDNKAVQLLAVDKPSGFPAKTGGILNFPAILSLVDIKQDTFEDVAFGVLPVLNFTCNFMQTTASLRVLVQSRIASELLMHFCPLDTWQIIKSDSGVIFQAKSVYHPSFHPSYIPYNQGFIPPDSLSNLPGGGPPANPDVLLYLQEPDGARETILNENEVLGAIRAALPESYTLTTLKASDNTWQKNKELFSQAFIVIGPHSPALANAVFCPPGTHIVEIVPPEFDCRNFPTKCYSGLSKAFGLNHWVIYSKESQTSENVTAVPPEDVLEILSVILDETMMEDEKYAILQRFYHRDMLFTLRQTAAILDDILLRPVGTRLLIFGTAEDVVLWQRANANGQTTFVLQQNSPAVQIQAMPGTSVIFADYLTDEAKWKSFLNEKTALAENFPDDLKGTVWDIVITMGPAMAGTFPGKSGSMKAIYWASQLIRPGTSVYVYNAQTYVEGAFSVTYLGQAVQWIEAQSGALAKFEPFEL